MDRAIDHVGNKSEIVGINVDVIARRNADTDFKLPRKVKLPINRLGLFRLAVQALTIEPDLGVGGRFGEKGVAEFVREPLGIEMSLVFKRGWRSGGRAVMLRPSAIPERR